MRADLRDEFDRQLDWVLERLPESVHRLLDEVPLVVDDYPSPEQLRKVGLRHRQQLCGLYTGIPLTGRSVMHSGVLGDVIHIFREGIMAMASDRRGNVDGDELRRQIRITILHELGHHHGLTESDLEELGVLAWIITDLAGKELDMQVAILHYHLNRGGVTQVVLNHLRGLAATELDELPRICILYGGRRDGWPETIADECPDLQLEIHAVPALDYDDDETPPDPESLARELSQALSGCGFDPELTLLHVHNHGLGKNRSMPGALQILTRRGYRLLLQIHDFAEDFRPANYRRMREGLSDGSALPELLYPQASQIHYATLNGRDLRVLGAAGLPEEQLHLLPNPVAGVGDLPHRDAARRALKRQAGIEPDHRYTLYPVRGIRRKNVGEALLWSALAEPGQWFGLTLAPMNPIEKGSYERWQQLARRLDLPFWFEAGGSNGLQFGENLAAADGVLTTSVAEGFGMVFLEPWLSGLSLAGRDLPEITADFRCSGLAFPQLYDRLNVPVDLLGREQIVEQWRASYQEVLAAFDRPQPTARQFADETESLLATGLVDFAALGHNSQRAVIEQVRQDAALRARLRDDNPQLSAALGPQQSGVGDLIRGNADVVRSDYSLAASGLRLQRLYQQVLQSPRTDRLLSIAHGEKILDAFLDLRRLHPVRIEP